MAIRAGTEADRALMAEVLRMAALASYPELGALGGITLRERLEGLYAAYDSPQKRWFVAEREGAAVGGLWALLGYHPILEAPEAVIVAVGVQDPQRGLGIGRHLMHHAHAALRSEGARSFRLYVHPRNAAALRLYEALGYRTASLELRAD